MTCDSCHQRPAKYHVTRVVNGERSEEDLCEECALQRGELAIHLQPSPATAIHDLLAGLLEGAGAPLLRQPQQQMAQCPVCGLTHAEFARTGLLGCEGCYAAFAETLRPLVRRVQGAGRHHGKAPNQARTAAAAASKAAAPARPSPSPAGAAAPNPLQLKAGSLREQLQAAIAAEEFERAAALRDRIRELEGRTRDGQA
jgi:protein arginine kinase activator